MQETFLVEGPNGLRVQFPVGTADAIVERVMMQAHKEMQPPRPVARPSPAADPMKMKFRMAGQENAAVPQRFRLQERQPEANGSAQDGMKPWQIPDPIPAGVQYPWEIPDAPQQPQTGAESLSWADVPGEALRNAPESAATFAGNLWHAVQNPIDTLSAVADLGAGTIRAGAQAVLPQSVFGYLDSFNTDAAQRAGRTASAVGNFYGDRYGSEDGFKRTIAQDPVGFAADLSTVLTGGAGGARAALGAGAKTTRAFDAAARLTNPLTPVIKVAETAGKGTSAVTKALLGSTTGTSAETIGEAYRAGRVGGKQQRAFLDNMRGAEDQTAVVEEARNAIGQIAEARSKQYADDMRGIRADTRPIDFKPIEQKFLDVVDSMYNGRHQVAADETIAKLDKIQDVLAEWSADKSMHTAGGLDALKRRIDNLMPSFADANAGNTERAVTAIRNVVKDEIIKAAPEYATAMRNYESSKAAQHEISKALSLGPNAATDTALRKLQSATRNDAGSNFGQRAKIVEALMEAGAGNLMPRLAGQALNARMPRGLMQAVAGASILGGSLLNPAFLGALPLTSPRLIGEAARAAGTAARHASKIPLPTRERMLMWQHLGRAGLLGESWQ